MKKFFLLIIFLFAIFFAHITFAKETAIPSNQPKAIEKTTDNRFDDFKKSQSQETDDLSNIIPEKKKDKKEVTFLDLVNALVIVIGLILATGWIYSKLSRINPENLLSGKFNKITENQFKIISSLQLGSGKSVHLIEINNKHLIVGATQNNINLLSEIEIKPETLTPDNIEKNKNSKS